MTTCPSDGVPFTVGRLLESGAAYLCRHGIDADEAANLAAILLSEALGSKRARLPLMMGDCVGENEVKRLRMQFKRLANGEPVQYLLGEWPFHDILLKTDDRALIPRPETEELVEHILKDTIWKRAQQIVDIGTGTGAITLALAHAARGTSKRFTAVDLSEAALSLARENAQRLGLAQQITFVQGDGASGLEARSCDILVSNPPYIATKVVDQLPRHILHHEPRMALDGGEDGLDILRQIVMDGMQVLRSQGKIFFEIGEDQGLAMQRLLERAGYSEVRIRKDFAGNDRYAEGILL